MFGYIIVNKDELRIKEWNRYRAYYCGLCRSLKDVAGGRGQMTLTYDMTFLSLLLDSLYECAHLEGDTHCVVHPCKKHHYIRSQASDYAAAMNILLCYDNLRDDWLDDHNPVSAVAATALKQARKRIAAAYPNQAQAVNEYLSKLHDMEQRNEPSLDAAAGATGEMLAKIFAWQFDEWRLDLESVGFYLGKFIYLMDAFEDREKDQKNGSYNPFLLYQGSEKIEDYAKKVLTMMASEATNAFERLPIVENIELLRNILYAGIWGRFERRLQIAQK